MSKKLVATNLAVSPREVARDLMGTIKLIEEALESSGQEISRVEGRGALKNLFSSSREDLLAISRSQNRINDLMLDMIREIITLNVMSYTYMAGVLDEFMRMTKSGWKDKDGQIQRLSSTGKDFADTAARIFAKIMDGARSTQQAIEFNAVRIEEVRKTLEAKESIDEEQFLELQRIDGELARKAELIAGLRSVLVEKASIDERQSRELEALGILVDSKAEQISRLGDELARKGDIDQRQSLELEALNILLGETSGVVAELHVLLQEKTLTDDEQTTKLARLEQHIDLQRDQVANVEAALGVSIGNVGMMNRRIVVASAVAAAVGCASAVGLIQLTV